MVQVVGLPAEFATQARSAPWWPAQEALAHTLAYDASVMGDYSLPAERAGSIKVPTLVLDGGASFDWMGASAQAVADAIPGSQRRTLEGQTHDVSPDVMGQALVAFFKN